MMSELSWVKERSAKFVICNRCQLGKMQFSPGDIFLAEEIQEVVNSFNPTIKCTNNYLSVMADILQGVLCHLCVEIEQIVQHKNTEDKIITSNDVIVAVKLRFRAYLAEYSNNEIARALQDGTGTLKFSVSRVHKLLKQQCHYSFSHKAVIAMTAVASYICTEFAELCRNSAIDTRRNILLVKDIEQTIHYDIELIRICTWGVPYGLIYTGINHFIEDTSDLDRETDRSQLLMPDHDPNNLDHFY
jgi:histone H3/H4